MQLLAFFDSCKGQVRKESQFFKGLSMMSPLYLYTVPILHIDRNQLINKALGCMGEGAQFPPIFAENKVKSDKFSTHTPPPTHTFQ